MALKPNYVAEILEWIQATETHEERVKIAKLYNSLGFRDILKLWLDDRLIFDLPEGAPPYTPCKAYNSPTSLFKQTKEIGICLKNSNANNVKKESKFIGILEAIHPVDAELLIYVKDKIVPKKYSKITKKLVNDAFPKLLEA